MAQTKKIRLNSEFGTTLKDIIDFTDDVNQVYATLVSNLLRKHHNDFNLKKYLKKTKKMTIEELNELKIVMTEVNKETGMERQNVYIEGSDLTRKLANDWDLQEIIYFVASFKNVIDTLCNLNGNKFCNEDSYLQSTNALKKFYEKIKTLCLGFIVIDVTTQLVEQL